MGQFFFRDLRARLQLLEEISLAEIVSCDIIGFYGGYLSNHRGSGVLLQEYRCGARSMEI
jgi:hypothetical protein